MTQEAGSYVLYYSPGACSLAAHIILEELGVDYAAQPVVIAEGQNQTPDYLAINPRGRVPALRVIDRDGSWTLTEVIAILVLLAQRHPQAGLIPVEPARFARLLSFMSWLGSTVHQTGARLVFRPEKFTTNENETAGIVARGREFLRTAYDDLERQLPATGFAAGETFSILDAYLVVFFRWGNRIGLGLRETCPRYCALMDRVLAKPSVRRIIEREGIAVE